MAKTEKEYRKSLDVIKWSVCIAIVAVAVIGNIYFEAQYVAAVRAAAIIVLAVIAAAIASTTRGGGRIRAFFKASRIEMSKVVWPSRQETIQTTMVVIGIVIVMGLLMLAIDSIFHYLIGTLIL